MNRLKNILMWLVIFSVVGLLAINVFLYLTVDKRSSNNEKRGAESHQELLELRESIDDRLDRLEAALGSVSVKNGVDGRDGARGAPGASGVDGKNGVDGTNGKDGVDGKDGENAPVPEFRCNKNRNRWEIRFFSNGEWTGWTVLGNPTQCTIPQD